MVGVTSQSKVAETDLYSLSTVTLERVLADDVRRIAIRVVGRAERARLVLPAVDVPTAVF